MRTQARCLATLAFLSAIPGFADPARAETSVSVYLGASLTRDSDLRVEQPAAGSGATFRDVSWQGKDFEMPPYYGFRVTRFFEAAPGWGASVEFLHYKVYAKTDRALPVDGVWNGAMVNEIAPLGSRIQNFSISHGVNLLALNGLYRFTLAQSGKFPRGRLNPYLGAGIAYYVLHPESTINNMAFEGDYKGSGFGYQVLGGLQYSLTERWAIFGEAKLTRGTAKVELSGEGRGETSLSTTHFMGGLSYTF